MSAASASALTNELANPDEIPPLRPAKPELLPGFWEQYGVLVSVAGVVVVLIMILLWRLLSRPTTPVIPAPDAVARQALEPLRQRTEDAGLYAEVSLVLRKYFIMALALPDEEFTNIELCVQLDSNPKVTPGLSTAAGELLRGMEHQRFTAGLNGVEGHAVQRALALIDEAEAALHPESGKPPAGKPRA